MIENEKMIKLVNDGRSKKIEYDSYGNDDGVENFQDTLQDSTMSSSGAGFRVINKIFPWITY